MNTILRNIVFAVGLFTFAIGASGQYSVPTNGLIGYWSGDGTAADSSPIGNNGTFGGQYAPGPTGGQAFNLGSSKVVMPNNAAYNFTSYNGWSVGFWFNGNGSTVNYANGLFLGQDNGSGYKPKWFVDYGSTVYVGVNDWYNFHVNDYNQERIFVSSQDEPSPVGWNQLTVTINNTNNGTVNFYLNGQFIGSSAMGNYVLETSAPLEFGVAEGVTFNGLMADVVIYNRVLTTNEVLQLATVPPLTITNQPTSVSVPTGGTTTFSVGAAGPSPYSFQWTVNGTNLTGATNVALTLTNISVAQVGTYNVVVSNSLQSVTSSGATLTTVDLKLFAGLVINGVVGTNYTIQSTGGPLSSNWVTLTNLVLPSQPYYFIDYTSISNSSDFYQAIATP
jgi:hypothetical protein